MAIILHSCDLAPIGDAFVPQDESATALAEIFQSMPVLPDYAPQPRRKPSLWRVLSGVHILGAPLSDWALGFGCVVVVLACACLP